MTELTQAITLIETHMQTLDTSKETCKCCDVIRYKDFQAYNEHTQLEAIVKKLKRFNK